MMSGIKVAGLGLTLWPLCPVGPSSDDTVLRYFSAVSASSETKSACEKGISIRQGIFWARFIEHLSEGVVCVCVHVHVYCTHRRRRSGRAVSLAAAVLPTGSRSHTRAATRPPRHP